MQDGTQTTNSNYEILSFMNIGKL